MTIYIIIYSRPLRNTYYLPPASYCATHRSGGIDPPSGFQQLPGLNTLLMLAGVAGALGGNLRSSLTSRPGIALQWIGHLNYFRRAGYNLYVYSTTIYTI